MAAHRFPPGRSGLVPGKAPHLEWTNCFFDPERGLADADRRRLGDQMNGSAGLIITVPLHDDRGDGIEDSWHDAVHQLLAYVSSRARDLLTVVAFPDAGPQALGPCVAAFNEHGPASVGDAHDPVLTLDCLSGPSWCGGSVPLRAVLTLLSGHGGAVDIAAAEDCWQAAGGGPAGLAVALDAHRHLLSAGTEQVALRLSPPMLHEVVARAVSQHVAAAIIAGGEGVELGAFRGPTLRLTNRWMSVPALLAATAGTSLAAFVLARKAEEVLRAVPGGAQIEVLQVGSTSGPLARHLSECLSLGGRFCAQPFELSIGEPPPIGAQVSADQKVVLCTDLICTENTVRRAVREIVDRGADPLVVVCAIDTRAQRGPIRLHNQTIPVVSLTEIDVGYGGTAGDGVIDIDPLSLRPAPPPLAGSRPADERDLLTWFAAPDVLCLGHVYDPPNRHYSVFVRLQAMRSLKRGDQITEAVLADVRHAFADIRVQEGADSSTEGPLAIWYVDADGYAERLAETVRDCLDEDGFQVDAITRVRRVTAGDVWTFPASLADLSQPLGVLIIHWWAVSGRTLLHLVRLAARSGARWVAAVCVLNQIGDANNADTLRMLRAVSSPPVASDGYGERPDGDPSRAALVPVSIRFVASSGISAFDPHNCSICDVRERYYLREGTVPPRLLQHAERLRDMLRPRVLEDVARGSAADLFGVLVEAAEAADYLRWRSLLLRARQTVRDRQEVIDRLRALAGDHPPENEWTSAGLIRLLAAEQHWLRLPPLYFPAGTDLLAQICVRSAEQRRAPLWLRVQALMVMSAVVPHHLVELLPRLLASAGNGAPLGDQMLLDCWLLLRPRPGHSPIDVVQLSPIGVAHLRRSLQECRDYLERPCAGPDAAAANDHLHVVRHLLTIADFGILDKPQEPQAAWARLQEHLVRPVVRHRLEAGLLLVRGFVEDAERVEPSAEAAKSVEADWDTCVRQLEERVLANLAPLQPIIAGDFVSDWLGRRDQRRLQTLARPDVAELRAVTDRLYTLARGPWRPGDPAWRAVRRELLDRINWWNRIFLAAHLADREMPALLVELIRSAPIRPRSYLTRLSDSRGTVVTETGAEYGQLEVFCPGKLLEQVVTHLAENLEKHQAPGALGRLHVAYEQSDRGMMRIVVRNSGTVARTPRGHGLDALNDKLRPFGGSLRGKEFTKDGWTFAAEVTLALWHGG